MASLASLHAQRAHMSLLVLRTYPTRVTVEFHLWITHVPVPLCVFLKTCRGAAIFLACSVVHGRAQAKSNKPCTVYARATLTGYVL